MADMKTCLITRREVERVFGMKDAVECVERAFHLYGEGQAEMPPKVYLTFEKGDLRCMPVYMPTLKMAGVKNVNVHPGNRDMPTVMALISLVDPETGFPLAVMDGTYLTSLRTGAAGAVAAKYLAREDSKVVGCVGAGRQAQTQLEGLLITRPGVNRVLAFDLNTDRAKSFRRWCKKIGVKDAVATSSAEEAVRQADIVVTVTPSRKPVVRDEWVRRGTHINAIGADAPGKEELEPAILKRARVIVDNWEQASHSGEINVPISQGVITRDNVAGDIGQVVTGHVQGRTSRDDITVFDSTGLAIQDVCCAAEVLARLKPREGGPGRPRAIRFF